MVKSTLTTICALVLLSASLFAQNKPYRVGTTAANFLEMGIGAPASAMGEAYVSQVTDLSSLYWNPAGLGYMKQHEALFMYQPWIADIDVTFAGVGIVVPGVGTLALGLSSMNFGRIGVTTLEMQDGTGETYEAGDFAISFSYGRKIVQWFSFGASAKYVSSHIWHMNASAAAVDLGVIVDTHFFAPGGKREHGLKIGMSISNYGSRLKYDGIDLLRPIDISPDENGNYKDLEGQYRLQGWELPLIFRIGVSMNPILTETQKVTIAVDALHPNNNSESVNMGIEYAYSLLGLGDIYMRGGYRGLYMDKSEYGMTFGAGANILFLNNKSIRIDYAYKDVGVFGGTNLYTVGFAF